MLMRNTISMKRLAILVMSFIMVANCFSQEQLISTFSYARYKRVLSTDNLSEPVKDSLELALAQDAFGANKKRLALKYLHKNRRKSIFDSRFQRYYYHSAIASNRILLADNIYRTLSNADKIGIKPYVFNFIKECGFEFGYINNDTYARTHDLIALQKQANQITNNISGINLSENNTLSWQRLYRLGGLLHVDKKIWMRHAFTYKEAKYSTHIVSFETDFDYENYTSAFQYFTEFMFSLDNDWWIRPSIHAVEYNVSGNKFGHELKRNEMLPHGEMYFGLSVDYKRYFWEVTPSISRFESDSISQVQMGIDVKLFPFWSHAFWVNPAVYLNGNGSVFKVRAGVETSSLKVASSYQIGDFDYFAEDNLLSVSNTLFGVKAKLDVFGEMPLIKDKIILSLKLSQYRISNNWDHYQSDNGVVRHAITDKLDDNMYVDFTGAINWIF